LHSSKKLIFADRNISVIGIEDLEMYAESSQKSEDDSDAEHWFNDEDNSNDNDEDETNDVQCAHSNIINSDCDDSIQEQLESPDNDTNVHNTDYPGTVQHEQAE
jgi:hypothetical protein